MRQRGATGFDCVTMRTRTAGHWNNLTYINAWEIVLTRNFLSTQVFLHGKWMVRTTLNGGIVNNDNTLTAGNFAYACDHSGTRNRFGIHFVCG